MEIISCVKQGRPVVASILIIEGEVDMTEVIKRHLKDAGHIPFIANDPYKGIKVAREEKPDLILMDLKLFADSGPSILRDLKTARETRGIPIVIIDGSRSDKVKKSALREGATAYLEKPYDFHELLSAIKEALEKKPL